MSVIFTPINDNKQLRLETERIKTLKVVGEAISQLVLENSISINAIKIDRINALLLEATDHLFSNKVVKQGIIRKEIFFIDLEGRLRFLTEDVPFKLVVDIPGVEPTAFTEVQNHLLDIDVDFSLTPARRCKPGCLWQKIVAHILVKVSEWTQLDVVTKIDVFPKINVTSNVFRFCSS